MELFILAMRHWVLDFMLQIPQVWFLFIFKIFIYLKIKIFIYLWLHWVFPDAHRLSLVEVGGLLIAIASLVAENGL